MNKKTIDKEHYNLCLEIATKAHEGQVRKFSGKPYTIHPLSVSDSFKEEQWIRKCCAILHDVVEDTNITLDELEELGVNGDILFILDFLTHDKKQSYLDYILDIKSMSTWHGKITKEVKIADIKHNMSDLKSGNMLTKYQLALYILQGCE